MRAIIFASFHPGSRWCSQVSTHLNIYFKVSKKLKKKKEKEKTKIKKQLKNKNSLYMIIKLQFKKEYILAVLQTADSIKPLKLLNIIHIYLFWTYKIPTKGSFMLHVRSPHGRSSTFVLCVHFVRISVCCLEAYGHIKLSSTTGKSWGQCRAV